MAKSEIIALMVEGRNLRGVRYVPRGSNGLNRTGGGLWPLEGGSAAAADENFAADEEGEVGNPLLKAARAARRELGGRDVVVAFPLSSLLLRILKLPVEMRDDLADAVALQMDKISPFDDGEYSVGYEVLSEDEESVWVVAATMSNSTFSEVNDPLSQAGWRVVRSDVALLGWLRTLCGPFKLNGPGRRIVLVRFLDDWGLLVMNHGTLVMARCFGTPSGYEALLRELTLSMLSVEIEAGPLAVVEIIVTSSEPPAEALLKGLEELFSVRPEYRELPSPEGGLQGVALRGAEQGVMDLTPGFWHDQLRERSVRRKVNFFVAAACLLWALFMAGLLAGPLVYQQLSKRMRAKSLAHFAQHKAVSDTRKRVNLILSYTDRQYSPLEILRIVSGYLPQGITLTGFNYKRQDGVKISGEAEQPTLVYQFKDAITEDALFETVELTGPSASRGKHNFEVYAVFKGVAEE